MVNIGGKMVPVIGGQQAGSEITNTPTTAERNQQTNTFVRGPDGNWISVPTARQNTGPLFDGNGNPLPGSPQPQSPPVPGLPNNGGRINPTQTPPVITALPAGHSG